MNNPRIFPYSHRNTGLNAQESGFSTINQPSALQFGDSRYWVAIEWNGTNIESYASFDGYSWWHSGTEPGTFFTGTPDLIGFGWEAVASDGGTQHVWSPHFYVTTNLSELMGLKR